MQKILSIATLAVFSVCALFVLNFAIRRAERAECVKWHQQANEYPGFYLTQWQRAQCEAVK